MPRRPVISCKEGQCFSETKEVPMAKLKTPPRLRESTGLPQGISCIIYKGSNIALARNIFYLLFWLQSFRP